jgi:hypothetical protein
MELTHPGNFAYTSEHVKEVHVTVMCSEEHIFAYLCHIHIQSHYKAYI